MTALDHFKETVGLPADFGAERPYVRFAYVDESKQSGADADVEYRELDSGSALVVTVSEWKSRGGEISRIVHEAVVFDVASGEIQREKIDQYEDLIALTISMDGMTLGDGDEGAAT